MHEFVWSVKWKRQIDHILFELAVNSKNQIKPWNYAASKIKKAIAKRIENLQQCETNFDRKFSDQLFKKGRKC